MLASRRAAVLLAILAMTLRGLLPAGWMPNPDGMRETALIICDMGGAGMHMAHMDHGGMPGMEMPGTDPASGPLHKHADDGHSQPCPFAAAPHFATPSVVALLSPPSLAAQSAHPRVPDGRHVTGTGYTPQAPRAPPTLA